ncbi:ATP-dependent DNA helicase PIF1 [Exaiptasia diaphana]|nr:ATP-dependent DNA helicase PIF1 [Exaiptasia diaphana]
MKELIDNMRAKDDPPFIEMLNRFRTASQTGQDIKHIQSRSIDPEDQNYPSDAIHIFAENKPVDQHNNNKLHQLSGAMFTLRATDKHPPNVSQADIDRVLSKGRSDTGGLDYVIHVKEGARVMLTSNIDIADRLINGQIGDFNMNYLNNKEVQALSTIMEQLDYVQTVQGPTFISGSLLDHVYIRSDMFLRHFYNCNTSILLRP